MMNVLKRALGTTLAAGALLLTVGALPASAQAATTSQVFPATAFSASPYLSNSSAINIAYAHAAAAGYTVATQCTLTHPPIAYRITPTLWQSNAVVTCTA
ncbi:hypothetical protein ACFYNO_04715 [Kitasatospora sp. NPDC006697]|uniref:hypothetical protein n=1 Tax=Kitasatospora sp. NPDC006697 TaxID=3364020 RepID=UPI0036AD1297